MISILFSLTNQRLDTISQGHNCQEEATVKVFRPHYKKENLRLKIPQDFWICPDCYKICTTFNTLREDDGTQLKNEHGMLSRTPV